MSEVFNTINNRVAQYLFVGIRVYVEANIDKLFWKCIFKKINPKLRIKIVVEGCSTSVEKQMNQIAKQFKKEPSSKITEIVCLDSDYHRYIIEYKKYDSPYIFQTYTHSIENYMCVPERLQDVWERMTTYSSDIKITFDFRIFLQNFSQTIYPLFIYFICCKLKNDDSFTHKDFERTIQFEVKDMRDKIENHGEGCVNEVKKKIKQKIQNYQTKITQQDFIETEETLNKLQITENKTFLYVRGHDLKGCIISPILKTIARVKNIKKKGNDIETLLNNVEYYLDPIPQFVILEQKIKNLSK